MVGHYQPVRLRQGGFSQQRRLRFLLDIPGQQHAVALTRHPQHAGTVIVLERGHGRQW